MLFYADDSCLLFQHKDVKEIEVVLTRNFSNLCDWFVENKLSIHLDDDKTKSILFSPKSKAKAAEQINIHYKEVAIKQHSQVKYLGCILDKCLTGELMALYAIDKINSRLKFLCRIN